MLGPYKYLTQRLMEKLDKEEKLQICAKLKSFPSSGLPSQISSNSLCQHYKSFHGRDFKILAQIALYVFWDHLDTAEREVWKALTMVFIVNT